MTKYAHPDVLDNGPAYIKANCNKVILITAYSSVYATVNGANKIAEAALVTGDFALSGADGAARVLTATLTGKSMGNALRGQERAERVQRQRLSDRTLHGFLDCWRGRSRVRVQHRVELD